MSIVKKITIPSGTYNLDLACSLGARLYVLGLRFNQRTNAWHLDLKDSTGKVLIAGLCLRTNRNALAGMYSVAGLPRGLLFVEDTTGEGSDPSADSFASTHNLLFVAP